MDPDSVVGVVTQPDRPSGRGQKTAPSPVHKIAEAAASRSSRRKKFAHAEFLDAAARLAAEIIVVVAYGTDLAEDDS